MRRRHAKGIISPWLLTGGLLLLSGLGVFIVGRDRAPILSELSIPWPLLAGGFVLAGLAVVSLSFRGLRGSASLGAFPLVLGLLFTPFWGVLAAGLVGTGVALALRRESPNQLAPRLFFIPASAVTAILAFDSLVGTAAPFDPQWLAAMCAAAAATGAVTALVSFFAARLDEDDEGLGEFALSAATALAVSVAAASLALAAGALMIVEPYLALLLVPPAALLLLAHHVYVANQRERDRLEFLMTLTRSVNEAPRVEDAVLSLLGHLRRRFGVSVGAMTLLPAGDNESALLAQYGPSPSIRDVRRLDAAHSAGVAKVVGALEGAVRGRPSQSPGADLQTLVDIELAEMALVPVAGRTRTVGALVLTNTAAEGGSFTKGEVAFLGEIGAHVGAALEAGRLEKSLEQLVHLKEQLHHTAYHDALTGLPNRALFNERLSHALTRQARTPRPLAVLFVDLDDFKAANDTYGHETGDWLLTSVAERLESSLREEDSIARLGGDEFAILLEETPAAEVPRIAERLVEGLNRPFDLGGGEEINLSASIGVALSPGGRSADEMLRNADVAMYRAKAQGKARHNLYEEDMREKIFRPLQLKRRLEGAISRSELDLHFQPIYDLETRHLTGAEALLRWNDEELGSVSPGEFISLAEETGLIVPMGRWALARACETARVWHQQTAHPPWVSVNVSANQLEDRKFPDLVARTLADNGLDPSGLVLEVTESVCLTDDGTAARAFAILQKLGVRIALDDFGSGYSSLGVLQGYTVSILKLDRTFIEPLQGERDTPLLREMLRMANSLDLLTVGEGIERVEQLDRLKELGCRLGQGYMLGRPMETVALEALLGEPVDIPESAPAASTLAIRPSAATAPDAQPAVR